MAWKSIVRVVVVVAALACTSYAQGPWARAVHIPAPPNSAGTETDPFVTKDGLNIYFTCPDCGGLGSNDIWVSHRASTRPEDRWEAPVNLGSPINTSASETQPVLSADEQRLYFTSTRPGGKGGADIWVSHWTGSGWGTPENLGDSINTSANEGQHTLFEDPLTGTTVLYFITERANPGSGDIYVSALQPDGTFSAAVPAAQLNSTANEQGVSIRSDGLEIFFMSNRQGSIKNLQGNPSNDIWTSTRASTSDPWTQPVPADPCADSTVTCVDGAAYLNTRFHDGGPNISSDGMSLYFHSAQRVENVGSTCATRPGTCFFDLWVATRPDTTPPDSPTPRLSPQPNAAGWNNSDVLVSFDSNGDAGPIYSGVADCTADIVVGTESSGEEVSGTCRDNSGNVSAPAGITVRLDKTPPLVAVTGVTDGATYLLGSVPAAGCSSSDGLSGLAGSASFTVSGGGSNGVGVFTGSCSGASDIAGNVAAPKSATFSVVYGFSGFLSPLNSGREFKLGSTIPIKWQLQNVHGEYVSSLNSVQSLQVAYRGLCSADAGAPFDLGSSGASGLRYDTASSQFVFDWNTKGLAPGCYSLVLTLDDATFRATTVSLK